MNGKFNYEKRPKYPHLIGEDTEIWNTFIDIYPQYFYTVDYDVLVGQGGETESIPDENSKRQWAQLTKKRIDLVGYKDTIITIVEVKKRVTLGTLGQILGYKFFFLRENPEISSVRTLIITGNISKDDIDVLSHYNIPFFVV